MRTRPCPSRRAVSAPPVRPGPRPVRAPRLVTPRVLGRIGGAGVCSISSGVGSGTLVLMPNAAGMVFVRLRVSVTRGALIRLRASAFSNDRRLADVARGRRLQAPAAMNPTRSARCGGDRGC